MFGEKMSNSKFVLLDRDGIIFKYRRDQYVNTTADIEYIDDALNSLKKLTDSGFKIIVISNQAGVGKGLMSLENLEAITIKLLSDVKTAGSKIEEIYYCIHKTDENCECRKPKPGLIYKAAEKYNINLSKTFLVGDNESDIEAGKNAGCKTILVLTGNASLKSFDELKTKPDFIEENLSAAVNRIIGITNAK